MLDIIKQVLKQVTSINMNKETIKNLNSFFEALNIQLKGNKDTLIKIEATDSTNYILTNLFNSYMAISHVNNFLIDLKDYIMAFYDNKDLLFDIFYLLLKYDIITLNQDIRALLFKKLYLSGYFCYVSSNKQEFLNNWSYCYLDLKIIANIVSNKDIDTIDNDLKEVLLDMYLIDDDIDLKEVLV